MTLRVGAVVVHWRGMDDLLECLGSLAAAAESGTRIVVAVNGGGDFDERCAGEACPGVEVVLSDQNRGYAAGCNMGWRALAGTVDVVMFLNNDVVVGGSSIAPVVDWFEREARAGVAGPPVVYYDDPRRVWALGGSVRRALGYTRQVGLNGGDLPRVPMAVDYVSGSAIAVRTAVLEQLGGWDEAYFHFFEEADLCVRARDAGFTSAVLAVEPVRHKVSASSGERGSARFNRAQAHYFTRNRVRFFARRNAGWRKITSLVMQPALVAYECAQCLIAGRPGEALGRVQGLLDGVLGRTGERRGGW